MILPGLAGGLATVFMPTTFQRDECPDYEHRQSISSIDIKNPFSSTHSPTKIESLPNKNEREKGGFQVV